MSETSPMIEARWPLAPSRTTDWLRELADDDGLTGFMPPPLPDAAWVLNAMYEYQGAPGDVTHDEHRRGGPADGSTTPLTVGDHSLEGLTTTGGGLGRSEHPGAGWRRLRWAELARRTGDAVVPEGLLPSYRCLPGARTNGSWPLGIEPPTEGSLDRPTWNRLVELLTAHGSAGPDTRCLAYYNPMLVRRFNQANLHVRAGRLGDAAALYDNPEADFTPSNLWAEDHSWVLCTDYDLWATKVAGPAPLIEALLADTEIEAVRLPWAP
ncbi:hypothetical protein ACFWBF_02515 [Streptomyces sp. NPDC060028]|uniref:hypothetical protein n=1 Tax=Streptomyces sp. NPDC060028 TaxID=3347041 RepID=UPI003680193F